MNYCKNIDICVINNSVIKLFGYIEKGFGSKAKSYKKGDLSHMLLFSGCVPSCVTERLISVLVKIYANGSKLLFKLLIIKFLCFISFENIE